GSSKRRFFNGLLTQRDQPDEVTEPGFAPSPLFVRMVQIALAKPEHCGVHFTQKTLRLFVVDGCRNSQRQKRAVGRLYDHGAELRVVVGFISRVFPRRMTESGAYAESLRVKHCRF